jgi:hypothetical protein
MSHDPRWRRIGQPIGRATDNIGQTNDQEQPGETRGNREIGSNRRRAGAADKFRTVYESKN